MQKQKNKSIEISSSEKPSKKIKKTCHCTGCNMGFRCDFAYMFGGLPDTKLPPSQFTFGTFPLTRRFTFGGRVITVDEFVKHMQIKENQRCWLVTESHIPGEDLQWKILFELSGSTALCDAIPMAFDGLGTNMKLYVVIDPIYRIEITSPFHDPNNMILECNSHILRNLFSGHCPKLTTGQLTSKSL